MSYKKYFKQGFSLVELMIAVAIITVLTLLAVPQYQTYSQRSRVSASLNLTRPIQLAIAEYAALNARLPESTESLISYGISAAGSEFNSLLVQSVQYGATPPAVILRYRSDDSVPEPLRGKTLQLKPSLSSEGLVRFTVSEESTLDKKFLPRI